MIKELKFLCSQPDDSYYKWQVNLWLESLKKIGKSDKAIVLVYTPAERQYNTEWDSLKTLYPEATFGFYRDEDGVSDFIPIYIPVLRPYTLMRWFKDHPEMKEKAIFYCDCDIVFTENFNIDAYINDDVCYLSDTNSYINASYFDSKKSDVLQDKQELYNTRDVLGELTSLIGISRQIAEENNLHSGGAQYLLKNIDYKFWQKAFSDCILIRRFLLNINGQFFESENKGYQSWCADMWSVLWNLWYKGYTTQVIKEMDFAWATDHISRMDSIGLFHNAGISNTDMGHYKAFYKGRYIHGNSPFNDLDEVYNNEESKKYCTHYYVSQLVELKNRYNLK
jgi:hypothetical protein